MGVAPRGQTPRLHLLVEGVVETLEAVGVRGNRSAVFLQNDVRGWRGADDCREPTQGGRVPMGSACVTAIVPPHEGVEANLGSLESAAGVFTRPGELSDGFLCHLGDRAHGELP